MLVAAPARKFTSGLHVPSSPTLRYLAMNILLHNFTKHLHSCDCHHSELSDTLPYTNFFFYNFCQILSLQQVPSVPTLRYFAVELVLLLFHNFYRRFALKHVPSLPTLRYFYYTETFYNSYTTIALLHVPSLPTLGYFTVDNMFTIPTKHLYFSKCHQSLLSDTLL